MYKFSMAWSRVLPTANASSPNPEGVQFYHDLIGEIKSQGMTPVITLYHFDHPQLLEDQFNGWQSRQMVEKFAEYSKFVFDEYGNIVPLFVTINEPNVYCSFFFHDQDPYQCIHNNILAHRAAYSIYQEGRDQGKYTGKVGYSVQLMQAVPETGAPEDVYAADVFNQLHAGTSLNPVVYGDYPQEIKALLGDKLPRFTDEEKAGLADTTDFIGLNVYFGVRASYNRFMNSSVGGVVGLLGGQLAKDVPFLNVSVNSDSSDPSPAFSTIDPAAMKNALLWTWLTFGKPIFITENGFDDAVNLGTHDLRRAAYYSTSLRSLVTTVKDYDVQVLAYTAWSLIDSFEFSAGYVSPFGLVHVDYEGQSLNRSLKDSSVFWIQLAETGVVPYVKDPATPGPPTPGPATLRSSTTTITTTILPLALIALLLMLRAS